MKRRKMANKPSVIIVFIVICITSASSQVGQLRSSHVLSEQQISTAFGDKRVVAFDDHRIEVTSANATRTKPEFRYSTTDSFLYMVPLGAVDQPDRMLSVWEGPTVVTHVVIFSFDERGGTNNPPRTKDRVLLDVHSYGLPSILYVRDAEILILKEKGESASNSDGEPMNRILVWDGERYLERGVVTNDKLWSALSAADLFIKHRNDTHPVVVKP